MAKKKIEEQTELSLEDQIAALVEKGCTAKEIVKLVKGHISSLADGMRIHRAGEINSAELKIAARQLEADKAYIVRQGR